MFYGLDTLPPLDVLHTFDDKDVPQDGLEEAFYGFCRRSADQSSAKTDSEDGCDSSDCPKVKKRRKNSRPKITPSNYAEYKRMRTFHEIMTVLNSADMDSFEALCRIRCDGKCTLKTPTISENIMGENVPSYFWKSIWAAIPDAVVSFSDVEYNESMGVVSCQFDLRGTKIFHRQTDVFFSPRFANDVLDASNTSWPLTTVNKILSDFHSLVTNTTFVPQTPGQCSAPVISIKVIGVQQFHFDEDHKIKHIGYSWTMNLAPRQSFDD